MFGRVLLSRLAEPAGVPPAYFDHWSHRGTFTCRLCHVDVGFAMEAGASQISRATNSAGLHCGACHDGKKEFRGTKAFAACSPSGPLEPGCARCHGLDASARRKAYFSYAGRRPTYGGGYVDWEAAEPSEFLKPLDFVEGVSIARAPLAMDRDIPLDARDTWVGDVTFSHRKHAIWNGCEVCHPEIFPKTKRGAVRIAMRDLVAGKYCGACHRSVAFSLAQCHRCHKSLPGGGGR